MRSHLRTVVVLAAGRRPARVVPAQRRSAAASRARSSTRDREWLALSLADDVREPRDSRAALAVPARAARADRASATRFARRPSGLRRAACCRRAPARSFARIFSRATRRMSATGAFATIILERLLDMRDGARAARVVRVRLRPRARRRPNPVAFAAVKWAGADRRRRRARRRWSCCSCSRAIPARLGRDADAARARRCRRRSPDCSRGVAEKFARGLGAIRQPGRLLVALLWSFPLWLSIALGIWAVAVAFHLAVPFTGSFLIIALLVARRRGADARRGRRLSRGVPLRRDDVLRRAGRRGGRRGDRAARCSRSARRCCSGCSSPRRKG